MNTDALFDPSTKSQAPSRDLKFSHAEREHREAITKLMAERNPDQSWDEVMKKTDREIVLTETDPKYWLFVATLHDQVVGLCRYFHSEGLPAEKVAYPAPLGWYCMGMLVDSAFRRQGIARFLSGNRLNSIKSHGATVIYSTVNADNLASVKMHEEFGFKEIDRGPGFLHIKFERLGILFKKDI